MKKKRNDITELDKLDEKGLETLLPKNLKVDDTLRMYLKEISSIPPLKPKEEIELAKRVEKGDKAAKKRLIEANLKLVISLARKFIGYGINFLDIIQEGNFGLMKAVEKFNYRFGNRFSTYASFWIKQAIAKAVADVRRPVKLPLHMMEGIRRYKIAKKNLFQKLGRQPKISELAKETGFSSTKIKEIISACRSLVSLETPIDEEGAVLEQILEDVETISPEEKVYSILLKESLGELLSTLTPREQEILRLRFGLDGEEPATLEDIGKIFNITRERVRQIERRALRKLKTKAKKGTLLLS